MGNDFLFENSEEIFEELCSTIPAMKGLDYEKVGEQGVVVGWWFIVSVVGQTKEN